MAALEPKWWKEGICYQVWPASFKDSNGDGYGDIQGLISSLDYLKDLGADYIWLSPMYDSPRDDYGYDIRNYEDVYATFGTLADMDQLIKEVHGRGMRLVLDLVVNHTSDQHKWFQESRKSRDNPYSDWYIWRDPKIIDGERHPPNNWTSFFGGSGWKYEEARDQYYLHLFLESMPDLNWENATTRRAIYDSAIEFWLKRGIDGFRVDTVNLYSKDQSFKDAAGDPGAGFGLNECVINGPRMHEFLQEQRVEAFDKYGKDLVLIGECGGTSLEEVIRYIHPSRRELDLIFDFDFLLGGGILEKPKHEWGDHKLTDLKTAFRKSQSFITDHNAWSSVFLENHDNQRSVSRFGSKEPALRAQSAKLLAMMMATFSGTLFLYQGQEIGMTGIPSDWTRADLVDPAWTVLFDETEEKYPNDPVMKQKIRRAFDLMGRDHSRTPVQWSSNTNGGFSTSAPWMRMNENYKQINVQDQLGDPDSVLSFWKRVLVFRKLHSQSLVYGNIEFLDHDNQNTMTYLKSSRDGNEKMLVALNFTDSVQPIFRPADLKDRHGQLLFGNGPGQGEDLQAWEGRVYLL